MKLFYRILLLGLSVLLCSESTFGQTKVYKVTPSDEGLQIDEVPVNYVEIPCQIDVSEISGKSYQWVGTKTNKSANKDALTKSVLLKAEDLKTLGNNESDIVELLVDGKLMMRFAQVKDESKAVQYTSAASYQPGNIYKDAMTLYNQTEADQLIVEAIKKFYNVDSKEYDQLNIAVREAKMQFEGERDSLGGRDLADKLGGSFDATNIIVGITDFLVERGKQELSIAFFDRFKQDLKDYPELTFLFPKSANIISSIETYNIVNVLPQLREAFIKDLLSTPENILDLRDFDASDCADARDNQKENCELRSKVVSGWFVKNGKPNLEVILPLKVASGLMNGKNVIDIMNSISGDQGLCDASGDVNSAIKLSYMLMEGLRSNNPEEIFVSKRQVEVLVNDSSFLKIWSLLVQSKFKAATCFNNLKIAGKDMNEVFGDLKNIANLCYVGLDDVTAINTSWEEFVSVKDSTAEKKAAAWLDVMSTSVESIEKTLTTIMDVFKTKVDSTEARIGFNTLYSKFCSGLKVKLTDDSIRVVKKGMGAGNVVLKSVSKVKYDGLHNDYKTNLNDDLRKINDPRFKEKSEEVVTLLKKAMDKKTYLIAKQSLIELREEIEKSGSIPSDCKPFMADVAFTGMLIPFNLLEDLKSNENFEVGLVMSLMRVKSEKASDLIQGIVSMGTTKEDKKESFKVLKALKAITEMDLSKSELELYQMLENAKNERDFAFLKTLSANLDIIQDMITDIQSKNYPGLFTEMLLLFETNDWLKNKANGESTLHAKFYNYLSLASSMATAKTPEEVKNALESAALPVGSYRLKQQSRFSMMVNGYIGYAWDIEMTQAKHVYGRGIYAPVGVSLSWGMRKYDFGVFASAFDFGSIASYRIQNETDTIQQKFAFESLFSPGIHASIRLLKPIVLSVGVRSTPKLFYNDTAGKLIIKPQQTTLNVGLLIDIPIFNLKSTPIDKRK